MLDRVGGGDGFAAGFFYGLLTGESPEEAVKLGWAHGALLTTFPGDTTMATLDRSGRSPRAARRGFSAEPAPRTSTEGKGEMTNMEKADIGLIGLAVMGENLVLNMESHGYTVAVFNRTTAKVDELRRRPGQGEEDRRLPHASRSWSRR